MINDLITPWRKSISVSNSALIFLRQHFFKVSDVHILIVSEFFTQLFSAIYHSHEFHTRYDKYFFTDVNHSCKKSSHREEKTENFIW